MTIGDVTYELVVNSVYGSYTYKKHTRYYTIKVKDGYFESVREKAFYSGEVTFKLDVNGDKIPDGLGGYVMIEEELRYDYEYYTTCTFGDNIDASLLQAVKDKVAEIDEKIESGEIVPEVREDD